MRCGSGRAPGAHRTARWIWPSSSGSACTGPPPASPAVRLRRGTEQPSGARKAPPVGEPARCPSHPRQTDLPAANPSIGGDTFADQWKQADYSDVLVLAAHIGEKVNVLVASKSKDVHAGNVIKVLAPIVSGRGGGKPDMAMAGGSDANGIQDLLSAVAEQL